MELNEAVENFKKAMLESLDRDLHLTQILEWILRHTRREREGE